MDQLAPENPDYKRTITPSEVTLFRYSALTYNSHKLHYDHPYSEKVEGYPKIVGKLPKKIQKKILKIFS